MHSSPVGKALFKLSAPAITGMIVMAVYNVVDTFFVSLLNDTTALAATGIVFPIFQLIGAIGLTFGVGASSVISRKLGEKDFEAANHTSATAFYSSLSVGIVFSILGAIFVGPLLSLFGATQSILEAAQVYGRIIIAGSVFQILNMTLNNILRSEGASIHSSTGQIMGALLNIILDPIFIFALGMGIEGAAIATITSQAASTFFLLSYYIARKGSVNPLNIKFFRFNIAIYGSMVAMGLPTFSRQILGSISFGILNNATAVYGDSAIAAISITYRLFMLVFMALFGLAQGVQPLAGYNYGAKQFKRVKKTMSLAFKISFIICFITGVLCYIFSHEIVSVFAANDKDVIKMGAQAMRFMALGLVPIGWVIMFGGIFQALGEGRSALILAIGQQGVFLIPLIIFLPKIFGLPGIFAAQPAGFALAFIIGFILFSKRLFLLRKEEICLRRIR